MKKRMTNDQELAYLNQGPEAEKAEIERIEAMRRSVDPSKWKPITDEGDLEFIAKVKESLSKKRVGRPARRVPVRPIHMKWPEPLICLVEKYAEEDGLDYQSFIRTTVAKEIHRRQKEGA
jgi:predicted DNA binding CopG/RHH family protein